MAQSPQDIEPFPPTWTIPEGETSAGPPSPTQDRVATPSTPRSRGDSKATVTSRIRRMSKNFEESNFPVGFMAATSDFASSVASMGEAPNRLRRSSTASSIEGNQNPRANPPRRKSSATVPPIASVPEGPGPSTSEPEPKGPSSGIVVGPGAEGETTEESANTEAFENGYHFPPKYSWQTNLRHFGVAFWRYFTTPLGFCVVIYFLNVVAWGGMLFLLLCGAAPAMCSPPEWGGCQDINSPSKQWLEIASQILNALFCVTGFGLIPWRFRDWYYLLKGRYGHDETSWRRLAGIHRGWYRLPGSETLPPEIGPANIALHEEVSRSAIPFPEESIPDAPLTGVRAPSTKMWKMDFVVWLMVINTFLQAALSGIMWGMTRYTRPSWCTGLLISLGFISAGAGGIMMFIEGKKVKGIEGVPLTEEDREKLARDRELGIVHYNNISDKKPKAKAPAAEEVVEKSPSTST